MNVVLVLVYTYIISSIHCHCSEIHLFKTVAGCKIFGNDGKTGQIEIALIKEHRSDQPEKWKLPGGFMDPGEKIQDAAIREVREETGIAADFIGVMGIRETAKYKYGASDLYFGAILVNKSE